MGDYFVPTETCSMSEDLLHHSSITTICCGPCGLRNLNFKKLSSRLPDQLRIKHEADPEIIEIEDSPVPKSMPPVKRRGTATQISSIKNFKSGYAEDEQQIVNQRHADQKTKTGFSATFPIVHFSLGIACFNYDSLMKNGDNWENLNQIFSINEDNQILTLDQLAISLLTQAQSQAKLPSLKFWLCVEDEDEWSLAHNNPAKRLPQAIAFWTKPQLFSTAIEAGCYISSGSTSKLYTIWLYYMLAAPLTSKKSLSLLLKPVKQEIKSAKIKTEPKIKTEIKQEPTRMTKCSRPMSAEISVAKQMPGLVTQGRAKLLKEEFEKFASEDAAENVAKDTAGGDFGSEDDAITDQGDRYQMLENHAEGSNEEGNGGEGSGGECSNGEGSSGEGPSKQ